MSTTFASKPALHPATLQAKPLFFDLISATPLCIFIAALKSATRQKKG